MRSFKGNWGNLRRFLLYPGLKGLRKFNRVKFKKGGRCCNEVMRNRLEGWVQCSSVQRFRDGFLKQNTEAAANFQSRGKWGNSLKLKREG